MLGTVDKNVILKISIVVLLLALGYWFGSSQSTPLHPQAQNNNPENKVINTDVKNKLNNGLQGTLAVYQSKKSTLPDHSLYCIPESKMICSLEGCNVAEPNVFILLGDDGRGHFEISRCDNKPCDTYPATPYISGAIMEVRTIQNHGMLFKSSTLDQSFVEVVTLGTETYTSYGHCYKSN